MGTGKLCQGDLPLHSPHLRCLIVPTPASPNVVAATSSSLHNKQQFRCLLDSRLVNDANVGDPRRLFVGKVPVDATAEEIEGLFSQFGAIDHVDLPKKRGIGFVSYLSEEGAEKALSNRPLRLRGVVLNVVRSDNRPVKANAASK